MKKFAIKHYRTLLIVLASLLIAAGGVFVAGRLSDYEELIWKSYDDQLESIINAIDFNIDNLVKNTERDLAYVMSRREFRDAENEWRSAGDTSALYREMLSSDIIQGETTTVLLAITDGRIILSTDEVLDYTFPEEDGSDAFMTSIGPEGAVFFAHKANSSEGDIQYAVLTDISSFFAHLTGSLDGNTHLTLVDSYRHILIHNHGERVCVHYRGGKFYIRYSDSYTFQVCDSEGISIALEAQGSQTEAAETYRYVGRDSEEAYQCRMVARPTSGLKNGCFAIGASMNTTDADDYISRITRRNVLTAILIVTGMFILAFALYDSSQRNRRSLEELAILKEKNAAADELLKKNSELAHHQRLETIGTLTAGVAHEFNNLLTPIMGYSVMSLSKLGDTESPLADNMVAIYEASRRARDIVAQLSDLSRGNLSYNTARLSPDELVKKALTVTRLSAPRNVTVELRLHCPEQCLMANETQMTQVLTNLIVNAFQAMDGGGALSIETGSDGGYAFIKVSDTGCGMPSDVKTHIFEPFFTTKETGKGTGLGLAIAAQIAETYKGSLTVESEEGKGSTFTLLYPLDI